MNRTVVAALSAFEVLVIVAIGVAIAFVPLTVLWAVHFGLAVPLIVFWRAACDVWLLGHGVDLHVSLPPGVLSGLGLQGDAGGFTITVAALGFGLLTALLGVRLGRRAGRTATWFTAVTTAAAAALVLDALVALGAGAGTVAPAFWQAVLLPAFVLVLGTVLGVLSVRAPSAASVATLPFARRFSPRVLAEAGSALRAGTAAAALVLAAAAVLVTVLLVVGFARVVGLYEGLQAGALGGSVLTLAGFALLPNVVLAAVAWLVGPGFALGAGSSVSPLGTQLGPIPGFPILGILPSGDVAFGLIGLLVPLLAGFAAAVLFRRRTRPWGRTAGVLLGAAAVAGLELGLLVWWASGAVGPGRLQDAGADPWAVAVCAAVAIGIGSLAGELGARRLPRRAAPQPEDVRSRAT